MVKLISRVCAFYEKEGHVIMDCPFVPFPFHIRTSKPRHVELQNVAGALMDQTQAHEPKILVVQNRLRGIELGNQLRPHSRHIHPSIHNRSREPKCIHIDILHHKGY
jgi:hypothetical protein